MTSAKVITSLAVKVKKKKLSEFSVVKGDGVTALETGSLYHMAQIVKMQTSLSSLISTSRLFSLRTESFLLILLLAKLPIVFMIFSMKGNGCESLLESWVHLPRFQTGLMLTNTLGTYVLKTHLWKSLSLILIC